MSVGNYLSLEEARKQDKLDRFAKDHKSKGNERVFDSLLTRMANPKKKPKADQTSESD